MELQNDGFYYHDCDGPKSQYVCRKLVNLLGVDNENIILMLSSTNPRQAGWHKISLKKEDKNDLWGHFVFKGEDIILDKNQFSFLKNNGFGETFWVKAVGELK